MKSKKISKSAIAIVALVIVIIGVIVAAAVTDKNNGTKPVNADSKVESSFSMGLGQEYAYPKGDKKRIKIKTSDSNIVAADKEGNLKALAVGTAVITVKGVKTEVTVYDAPSEMSFSKKNVTMGAGEKVNLTADVKDIPNLAGIDYEVADESVATYANGELTAVAAGKTTVTAQIYNGIKAACQITVANAPDSMSYDGNLELVVGKSTELRPTLPQGTASSVITYQSSNPDVVKIEENGNATGVAEGEAEITATAFNGITATCKVTVTTLPFYIRPNLDASKPMVALSFDDGPNKSSTTIVLDTLEKYNGSATFFMVANRLESSANAECAKRMVSMGCQLGNHTYDHEHYGSQVTAEDITKAISTISEVAGHKPTAFRPTGGAISDVIKQNASAPVYIWSVDTLDWKYRDTNRIYNVLTSDVKDGDIVLMHDIYGTTADAVAKAVPELVNQGFQIVNIAELAYYKGVEPKNGEIYYSFR